MWVRRAPLDQITVPGRAVPVGVYDLDVHRRRSVRTLMSTVAARESAVTLMRPLYLTGRSIFVRTEDHHGSAGDDDDNENRRQRGDCSSDRLQST
jgi:hypothetical protein